MISFTSGTLLKEEPYCKLCYLSSSSSGTFPFFPEFGKYDQIDCFHYAWQL